MSNSISTQGHIIPRAGCRPLSAVEQKRAAGGAAYISYGGLYSAPAQGSTPANNYSRGCNAATRCRS